MSDPQNKTKIKVISTHHYPVTIKPGEVKARVLVVLRVGDHPPITKITPGPDVTDEWLRKTAKVYLASLKTDELREVDL